MSEFAKDLGWAFLWIAVMVCARLIFLIGSLSLEPEFEEKGLMSQSRDQTPAEKEVSLELEDVVWIRRLSICFILKSPTFFMGAALFTLHVPYCPVWNFFYPLVIGSFVSYFASKCA